MILTRTPLRITLGGGGTDLDDYPGDGFCVAASIDKYVYVSLVERFDPGLLLTYSRSENVPSAAYLEHPIAKGCFEKAGIDTGLHVASMADIPAGTGLGSSGAYTVGLLKALYAFQRREVEDWQVALHACEVEKVGKQDQHIAAYGGVRQMVFDHGRSKVRRVRMDSEVEKTLEENLLLFFTGRKHDAQEALAVSQPATAETRDIGLAAKDALNAGELSRFARLLTVQWDLKRDRARSEVHDEIDSWVRIGVEAGALGGKLVGAGGGGFLLFYAESKTTLREAMGALGLREVRFGFDHRGSVVL